MIKKVLEERTGRYGLFCNEAKLAMAFKNILRSGESWNKLTASQQHALDNICQKMVRMVNGSDPAYIDNWTDIIGYATLVEKELKGCDPFTL